MTNNERMEICKEEIRRVYRVLGANKGIQQNASDIRCLRNYDFITPEEYQVLRKYSQDIFATMNQNTGKV